MTRAPGSESDNETMAAAPDALPIHALADRRSGDRSAPRAPQRAASAGRVRETISEVAEIIILGAVAFAAFALAYGVDYARAVFGAWGWFE